MLLGLLQILRVLPTKNLLLPILLALLHMVSRKRIFYSSCSLVYSKSCLVYRQRIFYSPFCLVYSKCCSVSRQGIFYSKCCLVYSTRFPDKEFFTSHFPWFTMVLTQNVVGLLRFYYDFTMVSRHVVRFTMAFLELKSLTFREISSCSELFCFESQKRCCKKRTTVAWFCYGWQKWNAVSSIPPGKFCRVPGYFVSSAKRSIARKGAVAWFCYGWQKWKTVLLEKDSKTVFSIPLWFWNTIFGTRAPFRCRHGKKRGGPKLQLGVMFCQISIG